MVSIWTQSQTVKNKETNYFFYSATNNITLVINYSFWQKNECQNDDSKTVGADEHCDVEISNDNLQLTERLCCGRSFIHIFSNDSYRMRHNNFVKFHRSNGYTTTAKTSVLTVVTFDIDCPSPQIAN